VPAPHPIGQEAPEHDTSAPVRRVLCRLNGVKQVGPSQWSALCPSHPDRSPSLRVAEGDDGRALVKCEAGCETQVVVAAIGLRMADLFPEGPARRRGWQRAHIYTDESGTPLYRVCKFGPRRWATFRPDASSESGWSPGITGVRRVLYRLPDILNRPYDDPVWCCEGERDADTAARLGLVATTTAGNGWGRTDLSPLRARRCIVVCDQDPAGYQLGRARAAVLRSAGALVDDEDIVWPRRVNDLTDLVGLVGLDLYEVLEELRPIPERAQRTTRSIYERASPYAIVPKELLRVSILARAVYLTLDLLAGTTGLAKTTVATFAEDERVGRTQAAAAFHELEEAGHIFQIRRGNWRVINSRRSRPGRS
jgi:hypothetical protein